MQIVQEYKLDINHLDKMVTIEGDGRPSQGSIKFLMEQLEKNKFFKEFYSSWNKRVDEIIRNEPAIQKF